MRVFNVYCFRLKLESVIQVNEICCCYFCRLNVKGYVQKSVQPQKILIARVVEKA